MRIVIFLLLAFSVQAEPDASYGINGRGGSGGASINSGYQGGGSISNNPYAQGVRQQALRNIQMSGAGFGYSYNGSSGAGGGINSSASGRVDANYGAGGINSNVTFTKSPVKTPLLQNPSRIVPSNNIRR